MPITIPRFLERARKLEANPIFSFGSDPMMALLLAGAKRAIPNPRRSCLIKIAPSLTPTPINPKEKVVREITIIPAVAGILMPIRSENLPPRGAMIITVKETGKVRIPTFEGEYLRIFWRKKGRTKAWAAFIQKEKRLVPREATKRFRLNRWRSINGEGTLSSIRIRTTKQVRANNNHPHTKGFDP